MILKHTNYVFQLKALLLTSDFSEMPFQKLKVQWMGPWCLLFWSGCPATLLKSWFLILD